MADVPSWKPLYKGSVIKKLIKAPINANQRTARACSSRPKANNTTPNAMGVQMARLNNPIFILPYLLSQTKYVISTKTPKIMTKA
jgi:hypothetical protein